MIYPQGTILKVKQAGQFTSPRTNRVRKLNIGTEYWVGNSQTSQQSTGAVECCKARQPMGSGFHLPADQIPVWFEVIQ